jgi:hypothetical protein
MTLLPRLFWRANSPGRIHRGMKGCQTKYCRKSSVDALMDTPDEAALSVNFLLTGCQTVITDVERFW